MSSLLWNKSMYSISELQDKIFFQKDLLYNGFYPKFLKELVCIRDPIN